jgi:REP element-mobilizing transposase RayT
MWNDTDIPLAYLITFRTYGTWLHGDDRGSTDRSHNRYASPFLRCNRSWERYNRQLLKRQPLLLGVKQRRSVELAICDTCEIRKWFLLACNVRTNHVHTVVSARETSSRVLNALKANATRVLREDGLWTEPFSPWADRGSQRMLWTERSVARAVDYVLHGQGDEPPELND